MIKILYVRVCVCACVRLEIKCGNAISKRIQTPPASNSISSQNNSEEKTTVNIFMKLR